MRRVGRVNRVRRFDVFAVILLAGMSAVAARAATARLAAQGMPPGPGMPGPPTAALSGTALILGRVVDAGSNAPVRDAVVTLAPVPALPPTSTGLVVPPARDAQSVVTASDGRFLFRDLPAGQFNLSVRTATAQDAAGQGYGSRRPGGASQAISLGENEKMRDVRFRVWQSAVLSGAVTDETGEPAVDVTVTAMRVDYVSGRRRLVQAATGITDDRGLYRIFGLVPAAYVAVLRSTVTTLPAATIDDFQPAIGARTVPGATSGAPAPFGSGYQIGDLVVLTSGVVGRSIPVAPPSDDGHLLAHPTVFFPSAATLDEASILRLASGEEHANVDFQERLVPAVRISGVVTGPNGPAANIGVHLSSAATDDVTQDGNVETATSAADGQGQFTFLGVPAGVYTIKVIDMPRAANTGTPTMVTVDNGDRSLVTMTMFNALNGQPPAPLPANPTLWAQAPVTAGDADVTNLRLTLQTGARLTGHIEFDGGGTRPTADQIRRVMVTLDPADGRQSPAFAQARGQFDANGQFATTGLMPGQYVLRAGAGLGGWTLKSAVVNGRDISDRPLVVESGDINGLIITFTDHATDLLGTVRDTSGAPDRDAAVLVFPVDRDHWTDNGRTPRSERLARTTSTGTYSVSGLPAGEYFVIAVDDAVTADWTDPAFLEAAANLATRVTVTDSASKTTDLRTSQLR